MTATDKDHYDDTLGVDKTTEANPTTSAQSPYQPKQKTRTIIATHIPKTLSTPDSNRRHKTSLAPLQEIQEPKGEKRRKRTSASIRTRSADHDNTNRGQHISHYQHRPLRRTEMKRTQNNATHKQQPTLTTQQTLQRKQKRDKKRHTHQKDDTSRHEEAPTRKEGTGEQRRTTMPAKRDIRDSETFNKR
ncbi:uncharacterized protein BDZ99DRAFT_480774 [Mytilinidion resinicola]|uniref:Uncharacterized protein n=1 Tax=Mytilinidion resinicola TaxID=574789 RepID=A0A6A6YA09_9PEZI|nr:uncharacterized protein BDZ99DRAFT_480774 [Mytilinidion resinicola]KAF2805398.1 hypothetical protein BDZ99DRAFT_480774 [Mytilinidion resinicola]